MKPYLGSAAVTARASTLETKIDFTNYVFKRTHCEKLTFFFTKLYFFPDLK